MNSFLVMDDDDDGEGIHKTKRTLEKADRKALPPYDTSLRIDVNFNSEVIGTTVRTGAFLSVPGQPEDSSGDLSCDHKTGLPCSSCDAVVVVTSDSELDSCDSAYDGIATTDSEMDLRCSPYDGIATTDSEWDNYASDSEMDFFGSPYDGILTMDPESELPYLALPRSPSNATPFTQAIYVEGGEDDVLASFPKPPGMHSFLAVHDDDILKSPTSIHFNSDVGPTSRRSVSFSVPGEPEDLSSDWCSDGEADLPYSGLFSSESKLDVYCSPHDGITTTDPIGSPYDGTFTTGSEFDFSCLPYRASLSWSSSNARRYGVDITCPAQCSEDAIPREDNGLVPTISHRTGLRDIQSFTEMVPSLFRGPLEQLGPEIDNPIISNCDISRYDGRNGLEDSSCLAGSLHPRFRLVSIQIPRRSIFLMVVSARRMLSRDASRSSNLFGRRNKRCIGVISETVWDRFVLGSRRHHGGANECQFQHRDHWYDSSSWRVPFCSGGTRRFV